MSEQHGILASPHWLNLSAQYMKKPVSGRTSGMTHGTDQNSIFIKNRYVNK